jgi:hypothetical protein
MGPCTGIWLLTITAYKSVQEVTVGTPSVSPAATEGSPAARWETHALSSSGTPEFVTRLQRVRIRQIAADGRPVTVGEYVQVAVLQRLE